MASETKPENPPAFPKPPTRLELSNGDVLWDGPEDGLTIRDYFAAKAMQALIARYGTEGETQCAEYSYQYADAMLAERNK